MDAIDNLEISIKSLSVFPIEPNIIKDMLSKLSEIKKRTPPPTKAFWYQSQLTRFIASVEAGENPMIRGVNFVVMSSKHYDEIVGEVKGKLL